MMSVMAPWLSGGQVAHFIMLLSCCPLLVWERGLPEGCCVAMYNSCWNSCVSGWEGTRCTHTEMLKVDFVVFQKHNVNGCWLVGGWVCGYLRCRLCTNTHLQVHTHPHTQNVVFGIQSEIKTAQTSAHVTSSGSHHHLSFFHSVFWNNHTHPEMHRDKSYTIWHTNSLFFWTRYETEGILSAGNAELLNRFDVLMNTWGKQWPLTKLYMDKAAKLKVSLCCFLLVWNGIIEVVVAKQDECSFSSSFLSLVFIILPYT